MILIFLIILFSPFSVTSFKSVTEHCKHCIGDTVCITIHWGVTCTTGSLADLKGVTENKQIIYESRR